MSAETAQEETTTLSTSAQPHGRTRDRQHLVRHVHVPRRRLEFRLGQSWAYRHAIPFLGWSVVGKRFRGTWLGWLWIPLRPSLQIFVKAFVFGGMLGLRSGDRPYLIFLLVGQASWDFFDRAVYWSFRPIRTGRGVLERAPVPWAAAIAATVIPAVLDALPLAGIGVLASCYYKLTEGSFFIPLTLLSPVELLGGLGLLTAWSIASALVLGPLILTVRDLRFIVRYLLSFWYFLTPVLYAVSNLPAKYRVLAVYNPLTAPIELIKDGLLGTGPPSSSSIVASVVGLGVILPLGLLICSSVERRAHARL